MSYDNEEVCISTDLIPPQRLSPWSRPPSISPSSFCCTLSSHSPYDNDVIPSRLSASSSGQIPSPVQYLGVMGQLSYIFYIYLKANAARTIMKSTKALEEIEAVKKGLQLHLSSQFPANADDARWEASLPWIATQRNQLAMVFDFMILAISRSLAFAGQLEDRSKYRTMAVNAARQLLWRFNTKLARFQKLLWSSSASAVAAGIFLALDYILSQDSPDARSTEYLHELLPLVHRTMDALEQNAQVTIHAEKGVGILRQLYTACQQWPHGSGGLSPRTFMAQFVSNRDNTIGAELDHANYVFPDMLSDLTSGSGGFTIDDDDFLGGVNGDSLSMYDIAMS